MGDNIKKENIGVVLLNLGGPDSLSAVRPFLYNLFSDRDIIRLGPPFLQKPLAWLISKLRHKKTERFYSLIGGRSPILDITNAQARALEIALNLEQVTENSGFPLPSSSLFKVFVAMRYWHPLIDNVVQEISASGIKKLIVIGLYPQYSVATTGSSISRFKEAISAYQFEVSYVESWFNHPLYIDALVESIKKGLVSFVQDTGSMPEGEDLNVQILFSAHSLPQKFIDEGDPYAEQITGTIKAITDRILMKWYIGYQSKSGPVKWLEPSTEEVIRDLAQKGIKNVLVVPISFVSDHIETLYEIDILYKQMAGELGVDLRRTESLNTHPLFIRALKEIVLKKAEELNWLR